MREIAHGAWLFAGGLAAAMPLSSFAALQTNVVERHYDRFGRLAGVSLNGERRTEIAYDEATGRIASMRVAGADEPFRWEYEPGTDLKKTLRYPNGATVDWEYESNRDLVTLVSNDVYSSYRYACDAAGRRVSKNDERYEYNVRGELVLATNVSTGAEFAYCYDDIGNRQWSCEFGTNCVYVANELNQYTNIVRGGVHELSAFDLDGNQTNVVTATGEWAVEYNGENRPVLWRRKSDGATIRMSYDRMGRRVRKNDETFVYDGYLNISQTIWDPAEPVATRPLVWRGTGGNAFYFHDGNKNVVDFVPVSSVSAIRHYDYAPFGGNIGDVGGDDLPWLFSSEFHDWELNLTYYNYRHYSFMDGRWMRRDPMDGINPYLWCKNNSSVVDYLGLTNEPGAFGWENYSSERFACCNGVKYFPSASCCRDGVVYSRRATTVGVSYYCKHARYWYLGRPGSPRQFMLTHCWLNVDGMRFGAYPNGGFLKEKQKNGMSIQDDSGHVEDEGAWNTSRTDIELSPCDYDIDAFKACLRKLRDSSNWEWRIWNNCGDFVDAAVTECMRFAERK